MNINIDIFTFLMGVVALCNGDVLISIALLYISLAFPTFVVKETQKQMSFWIDLVKKEVKKNEKQDNEIFKN